MLLCKKYGATLVLAFLVSIGYSQCKPVVNLGNVVTFCQGNSLVLNATYPNSTYLWSDNSTGPTLTVTTTGTYWVKVTNNCGYTLDTVQVYAHQPVNLNLPSTRTLCGSAVTLSAPATPGTQYLWNTTDTTPNLNVTTPGTYWVQLTNACGTFSDTVQVVAGTGANGVSLGPDLFPCSSGPVTLSVPNNVNGIFLWSNNSRNRSIIVSSSGNYWVKVTNPCGTFYDTVYVQHVSDLDLGIPDTAYFCPGSTLNLRGQMVGTYQWSNSTNSGPQFSTSQPGTYSVMVTHPCGTLQKTFVAAHRNAVNVNLGPDTTVCSFAVLNSGNPGSTYQWSNGKTTQSITVEASGWYSVQVSTPCSNGQDSVYITIKNPPMPELDTVGYCQNTPGTVDAGYWGPSSQYLWSNNSTQQVTTYNTTGWEWVYISNSCGSDTFDFYVRPDSPINLNFSDTAFCDSVPLYLIIPNWSNSTDSAIWNVGTGGDTLIPRTTGQYWITAFNTCDTVYDTVNVTVYDMPKEFTDSVLYKCRNLDLVIRAYSQQNVNYLWSDNTTADTLVARDTGTYWVQIYNRCDTIYDTLRVEEIDPVAQNIPRDTVLCFGDSLLITLPSQRGYTNYLNGQELPFPFAFISGPGSYIFRTESHCGIQEDTLNVQFFTAPVAKVSNAAFCIGGSVTLDASQPQATQYEWNTGDTTATLTVSQTGWYFVDITSRCRTIRDSAFVEVHQPLPAIDLGADTIFCEGTLLLDAGSFPTAEYRWQDGLRSQTYLVSSSGTYSVRLTNACGTVRDTIVVLITGPPKAVLGTSVEYCASNFFYLNAQNPGSRYQWNTGDTTQSVLVTQPGQYWVTITNDCGTLTDTVQVIPQYPFFDFGLPADTIICAGQNYRIDPHAPGAQIRWSTGSQDTTLLVNSTGYYSFRATNLCGTFRDTVFVEVQDTPVFNLPDTAICFEGDSLTLNGPPQMKEYLWSNGARTPFAQFNSPGTYWLTVSNQCFSYTDTFRLLPHYPIEFNLPEDTSICELVPLVLDLRQIPHPVTWENRQATKLRTIRRSGIFWARSRNRCGVFYDSVAVYLHESLSDTTLNKLLCNGDTLWLDLSDKPYQYQWPNGSTEAMYPVTTGGEIPVIINNLCGESTRTYAVDISNCECPVFMAKAFSPNNDGLNDVYPVVHSCDFIDFEWRIYSRWGQQVYQSNNPDKPWDGRANGELMPNGVYLYHMQYKWRIYGVEQFREEKGFFTLIR